MDKTPQKKEQNNEKPKQSLNAFARYSGLAFQIGGAVILGVLLGYWLDRQLETTKSHAFTITFTLMGVFLGLYSVIKDVLKK
jgi:F0F1-type ATP synthase assembly protein I